MHFEKDSSFLTSNCWALGMTTSAAMVEAPFISSAVQLDVEKQSLKYCNKYGYANQLDDQQHACIKAKWDSENQGFCQLVSRTYKFRGNISQSNSPTSEIFLKNR